MIYLIISILASVSVSILLKIAKKQKIDIAQAVAFNYPVAIILSFFLLQPDFSQFTLNQDSWLFTALGVLLPLIFIVMGTAVQKAGIVKADIAQRLSLVLTLVVAFYFWQEPMSTQKLIGVGLAFVALILILMKKQSTQTKAKSGWIFLLMVWLGYGVIDLIFKLISRTSGNAFSTTLTLSFCVAAVLIFTFLFIRKTKFNQASIIGGIILGVLNFTNIFTYIKAHQVLNESPSLVFTGMNLGVIVLGTLIGTLVFNEKLNKLNYFGILLAALAILLLFLQF